jgi:hypothetical protein
LSVLACACAALLVPAIASAQATRTWVSGVGDDANPCSRTAPCKTLAGAISKTAPKGEINVLDPAGVGAVTITKAITITGRGTLAGVLAAGGVNAIIVNAGTTDVVRLNNLDINGVGTGLNGIRILQAKTVKISNVEIYGFARSGIDVENSGNNMTVSVTDSDIDTNAGDGVLVAPGTGRFASVLLRRNQIDNNACGLVATTFGADPAANFAVNCGTASSASGISGSPFVNAFGNTFSSEVGAGVFSRGNKSTVRIGDNEISANAFGLQLVDPGAQIVSYGDNYFAGNTTNGTPTSFLTTG